MVLSLAYLLAYLPTCLQGSYSTSAVFYSTVCIRALWTRLLDLLVVDCRILCDDAVQEFICCGGLCVLCYAMLGYVCMHACVLFIRIVKCCRVKVLRYDTL